MTQAVKTLLYYCVLNVLFLMKVFRNTLLICLTWFMLDVALLFVNYEILDSHLYLEGVFRIFAFSAIALLVARLKNKKPAVVSLTILFLVYNVYRFMGIMELGFWFYDVCTLVIALLCFYGIIYFNQTNARKGVLAFLFLISVWAARYPLYQEFLILINHDNNKTIECDYSLKATLSNKEDFKQLNKKKIVLASLFNENCSICFQEMAFLKQLSLELNDSNVAFTSVHTLTPFDSLTIEKLRPYAPFPIYRDSGFLLYKALKTNGVPQLLIIDKTGLIRYHKIGYLNSESILLTEEIKKVILEIKKP